MFQNKHILVCLQLCKYIIIAHNHKTLYSKVKTFKTFLLLPPAPHQLRQSSIAQNNI